MSTYDFPPGTGDAEQPPAYPGWPGYGGAGYPGGPGGYGNGPGGYGSGPGGYGSGPRDPGGRVRRLRRGALLAAVATVAGAAAFVGVNGTTGTAPQAALTTSEITAHTDPGLVDVVSTLGYQQAEAAGTGIVLTSSGEVLTNNHVIEGATSVSVTDIGNGRTYQAKVVGYSQTKDVAVLQLEGASGLKTDSLGNSGTAAVGQSVVGIGNAGGTGGTPSVVTGTITALGQSITASDQGSGTSEQLTGLIEDNADIQAGDSGGPLLNSAGQVIGIDTAASTGTGFQFQSQQGQAATQAFAIPINEALSVAGQIEAGSASSTVHIGATGFLGVEVLSASNAASEGIQAGSGAAVAGLLPGSAAQSAGIVAGDVITSVDGQPVSSPSALQAVMEQHHPGDSVTIGWTDQSGQAHSATLKLAAGPAE